ncbi:hypothetical protein RDI58_021574 [Solanum bulbocastanum]
MSRSSWWRNHEGILTTF